MKNKQRIHSATTTKKAKKPRISAERSSETFSHPEPRTPAEPSEANIREQAYLIYEKANCRDGHDVDHWVEATAQLKNRSLGSWGKHEALASK